MSTIYDVPLTEDEECCISMWNLLKESDEALFTLRVSIARLAQSRGLGARIPQPHSHDGEILDFDMQEAPYEILRMAALNPCGWNKLVAYLIDQVDPAKWPDWQS